MRFFIKHLNFHLAESKNIFILGIMLSLATPYAGPQKLFDRILKLPGCIFIVAERKQSGAVIFFEE
jgi:hypothetical protein